MQMIYTKENTNDYEIESNDKNTLDYFINTKQTYFNIGFYYKSKSFFQFKKKCRFRCCCCCSILLKSIEQSLETNWQVYQNKSSINKKRIKENREKNETKRKQQIYENVRIYYNELIVYDELKTVSMLNMSVISSTCKLKEKKYCCI